jgi:tRNA U34 2-thiouridine synthase MnmA/TrmU
VIQNLNHFAARHTFVGTLRLVAVLLLIALAAVAPSQAHAGEGRIQITFFKGAYGSGSGYLFFQGQRYGLGVSGAKIGRVWVTTIDLIGTASNLRNAADIVGTYTAVDAQSATISSSKMARLENAKGTVIEVRAVNLNRLFSLNLSEMTIKALGWQPPSE